ncbi:MAG: DUF2703 domain-containing protein [Solirubrobacteraceae bacterium]|nr:DUF2703 domain-containing protein [Solirubrobacteraceae bacterium]
MMLVELLYWRGCPSYPAALAELREAMAEVGVDPGSLEQIEVHDEREAAQERFPGSPTIRVDGRDIADAGEPALSCRIYRRRDGRISPLPDPDDLRDALRRAVASRAGARAA